MTFDIRRPFKSFSETAWLNKLNDKWHEIPVTVMDRGSSIEQMRLSDDKLLEWWDARHDEVINKQSFWVVELYRDYIAGKKVIEVGPGAGFVGTEFLRAGAEIVFTDVVQSNLDLVARICRLKGLKGASFLHLTDFRDHEKLENNFD